MSIGMGVGGWGLGVFNASRSALSVQNSASCICIQAIDEAGTTNVER